jgi:DNA-binding NarL/FixJ family response regulator
MRMPGQTDGAALVSWLRQEKPHIKVIVVSGNTAADKLPNADARFSKPLDMEALVRQARHLLNGTSD